MADRDYDVVVVGAGPAGLAAACRAAECGRRVAMLDDNPHPGGQIWRGASRRSGALAAARRTPGRGVDPGRAGLRRARAANARGRDVRWRMPPRISQPDPGDGRARALPAVPGWTLPNVMGAGGLQALAKSGTAVAGKTIVVAGSGPLLLAVARYLRAHGVPTSAHRGTGAAIGAAALRIAAGRSSGEADAGA